MNSNLKPQLQIVTPETGPANPLSDVENQARAVIASAQSLIDSAREAARQTVTPEVHHPEDYIPLLNSIGEIRPMDDIMFDAVRGALEICRGNKKLAAEQLGIGRSTIHRYMKKMNGQTAG